MLTEYTLSGRHRRSPTLVGWMVGVGVLMVLTALPSPGAAASSSPAGAPVVSGPFHVRSVAPVGAGTAMIPTHPAHRVHPDRYTPSGLWRAERTADPARAAPPRPTPPAGLRLHRWLPHHIPSSFRPFPSGGPTNVMLTGNETMLVSTNRTVLNVTMSGNAWLYVHGSSPVTLTVLGDIYESGNATIYLNQSTLSIGESYDVEWKIQTNGTSRFLAFASNLTTNGYQWGAAFEGHSNVTVALSLFCYGGGWIDTLMVGHAHLSLLFSWYASDEVNFDNVFSPSTTDFYAADSAGFNVWLSFKSGTTGNLSTPTGFAYENWTFPGGAPVSGLNYSIDLVNSYVLFYAVMAWQGSSITLTNSTNVVVALDFAYGSASLNGLTEGYYANGSVAAAGLHVQLANTSVYTWNIYPFGTSALWITNSDIGEIQVSSAAPTTVTDSTLTGHGGYYGEQSTGILTVRDSKVQSEVVGYSGSVQLFNCTLAPPAPSRVLAVGSGRVYLQDPHPNANEAYDTLGGGVVSVAWTLHLSVTEGGVSAVGAPVSATSLVAGVSAASGTTDANGSWRVPLISAVYQAAGFSAVGYRLAGASGGDVGELTLAAMLKSTSVTFALVPLLTSSAPADGTANVPTNLADIVLDFADPMTPVATLSSVTVAPSVPWTGSWDASDLNLTISLGGALAANTGYTVSIGPGAPTQFGAILQQAVTTDFQTEVETSIQPLVVSESPTNGSSNVSLESSVRIGFNVPMNTSRLGSAFSIAPSTPLGNLSVNATALLWSPNAPLRANTTYTVTVSSLAFSASGLPLAPGQQFSFRTTAGSSGPGNPSGGGSSGSNAGRAGASPTWMSWMEYGLIGIVILAVAAACALVLFRRKPGSAGAPMPAPPLAPVVLVAPVAPPAPPPPWSESELPEAATRR